jgi:DNA-binding NarL/FixJ family response regulator
MSCRRWSSIQNPQHYRVRCDRQHERLARFLWATFPKNIGNNLKSGRTRSIYPFRESRDVLNIDSHLQLEVYGAGGRERAGIMQVLIVDDHPVIITGCRAMLSPYRDIKVIEARSADDAYELYVADRPDVVVIDINLPSVSGFALTRRILQYDQGARIIIFTMNDDAIFAARAIESGAKGYISKCEDPARFVTAVRTVADISCARDRPTARFSGSEPARRFPQHARFARARDSAASACRKNNGRDRWYDQSVLQDGGHQLRVAQAQTWCAHASGPRAYRGRK